MKLGILGGGQLGMMMCQEAKDLKISTFIFTDTEDSPATKFSNEHIIAQYDDFEKLEKFIQTCDVITYEFENIPYKTLNHILKQNLFILILKLIILFKTGSQKKNISMI